MPAAKAKPQTPELNGWQGSRPGSRHMTGPANDMAVTMAQPPVVQIELEAGPVLRRRDGSARDPGLPFLPASAAVQPFDKHSLTETFSRPMPPILQSAGPRLDDGLKINSFSEEQGAGPSHAHLVRLSSDNTAFDSGLSRIFRLESGSMPGLGGHNKRESEIATRRPKTRPNKISTTDEAYAVRQTDSPELFVPYSSIPENLPGTGGPERAEHTMGKWRQTVQRSSNSLRKHSHSPPRSRSPCTSDGQSFAYDKLRTEESLAEKSISLRRSAELQEYLQLLSVATSSRLGVWTEKTGSPRPGEPAQPEGWTSMRASFV